MEVFNDLIESKIPVLNTTTINGIICILKQYYGFKELFLYVNGLLVLLLCGVLQ